MPDPSTPVPPAGKPFAVDRVIGGYEIKGELGRGGMGVVYRARQATLNRVVALKMLTGHYGPDEHTRFLAEAETAAGLHHTNIIQIYEVGEVDGAPFFSMEYVESGSLADRLRSGPMEARDAAQLLISVARALHFAHQNGVVHRDMKPANVLLDPEGVPKVADFGIAKRLTANAALTLSGAIIGTPTYMAPEQAKGTSREVGAAADVYSLGAILYEMLAGRPPFLPGESETALTVRVITEDPVSPAWHNPGIPRDLETICLKCLEKEPRDRYASAAAFAEDLRRYLDDESILARPPNTAVRTLKWVRRNPWKFVTRTFLVVAVAAGLVWLGQSELYQRPRFEYAERVDYVRGSLEPIATVTKDEASHRPVHLRLTRRGRFGPITLVEVLNARGHPAVLRKLGLDEMIPIYLEALSQAQPNAERAPESSSVEFVFDTHNVLEAAIARDRNGSILWRLVYDRHAGSDSHAARARYVNVRGFATAQPSGASQVEFERDASGRDAKVTFFNGGGEPTPNGEGVYGYKFERDSAGRVVQLVHLDRDGKPGSSRGGIIARGFIWNEKNRLERVELRDGAGKPTTLNGVATVAQEYDATGNVARLQYLGADGKLARTNNDRPVQEIAHNAAGEVIGRKYFRMGADDKLALSWEWTTSYDEFGYPAEFRFSGATNSRTALRHDQRGNLTEETSLDAKGHPVLNERGYATKRVAYKFSPQGAQWEETYFDVAGAKTYCSAGYHRFIVEFSSTGVLKRQTTEELDPTRFTYYRDVNEPEYDSQGRLRRSVVRYEDKNGQLALNAGLPHAATEESYDENGRPFLLWKLGCAESAGAPALSFDYEWHKTGARKRRIRQACDANRKPLPFISNGNAARSEEEFDQLDRPERIYDTGFDEKRVGFATREAKFTGGSLQSVTHKRSDGSIVDLVLVIITAIFPSAEQPKAAELRVGDQLLAANDKPIQSGYDFVFSNFSGGSIEVLRDSAKLRIDGFNAGSLGIVLEDRAPTAKP
ncbi:MAG: eukaryotic-like serine/threonine-protein kinase [Verrucomicrobiota bacterium]|jgi:hypothetical protein